MDAKAANSAKFLDAISALSTNFAASGSGGASSKSGEDAGFSKLMEQMQARRSQEGRSQEDRRPREMERSRERDAARIADQKAASRKLDGQKVAGLSAQALKAHDDPPPERPEAPAAATAAKDAPPPRQAADKSAALPAKTPAQNGPRAADKAAGDSAGQADAAETTDATDAEAVQATESGDEVAAQADQGADETATGEDDGQEAAPEDAAILAVPVVEVAPEAVPETPPADLNAEIAAAAAAPAAAPPPDSPTVDETAAAIVGGVAAAASAPAGGLETDAPAQDVPAAPPVVAETPAVAAGEQAAETLATVAQAGAAITGAATNAQAAAVTDAATPVDAALEADAAELTGQGATAAEEAGTASASAQASETQITDKSAEKAQAKQAAPLAAKMEPVVAAAQPQASPDGAATADAPTAVAAASETAPAADTARAEEPATAKQGVEGEAKPHAAKKTDGETVKINPATQNVAEQADSQRGGDQNAERRNNGSENQRLSGGLGLAALNELPPTTETTGGPARFDSFLGAPGEGVKTATGQVGEAGAATGLRPTRGGHAHLQQAGATDQVAVQVKKAAKDGIERISMQLRPEELGRVDVRMEIAQDGKITAQIAVERAQTLELLQKDQKALEKALQEAGFNADSSSLNFSLKEQGGEAYREQAEQNGGGRRRRMGAGPEEEDAAANVVAYTVNLAAGRVDVRV